MLSQDDLNRCREKFGDSGFRKFSIFNRIFYLNIKRPEWCDKSENMWAYFKNTNNVLLHGNIVWGRIVQANSLLFEPGNDDCPASVVFCPNPEVVIPLSILENASEKMYSLKNTTPDNKELLKIANTLTSEVDRTFGIKVPEIFCNEYNILEASTFITRKHLPNKILSASVFPLLVSRSSPYYCFPLPSKYWSNNLIEYWNH